MAFRSRIYVDNRLHHTMALNINKSFWQRGDFPQVVSNGSDYIALKNPWANGSPAAPFDKRTYPYLTTLNELMPNHNAEIAFYLILNLAVGGTSGWFPDGFGEKPWLDGSLSKCRHAPPPLDNTLILSMPSPHVRLCQETG